MRYGIEALKGKTLTAALRLADEKIVFETTDGARYEMYHSQDCCESVYIQDICGHLEDLVGNPILTAEERTKDDPSEEYGIGCWTFYELATIKGSVTIRWYGSSNGYYGVGVHVEEVRPSADNLFNDDVTAVVELAGQLRQAASSREQFVIQNWDAAELAERLERILAKVTL